MAFIQIKSQESGTYRKGEIISSGLKYVEFKKIKIKLKLNAIG